MEEKDDKDLVKLLFNSYGQYNAHKENMAYSGALLQFGIFAYVMTTDQWPPCWINNYFLCKFFAVILFFLIWLLIHLFIGWQLRNRKVGAKNVAASGWDLFNGNVNDGEDRRAGSSKWLVLLLCVF